MERMVSKVQPYKDNRVTFLVGGQPVTGQVKDIVFGESFTACTKDGTIYTVPNEEMLRLVGGNGVYARCASGEYRYLQFYTFASRKSPRTRKRTRW